MLSLITARLAIAFCRPALRSPFVLLGCRQRGEINSLDKTHSFLGLLAAFDDAHKFTTARQRKAVVRLGPSGRQVRVRLIYHFQGL